jgi:hypothetical protein
MTSFLKQSKFLWVILALPSSPAKPVWKASWHYQCPHGLIWKSWAAVAAAADYQQNRYEKMLGTAKVLWIILAILRSPAKPVWKDSWSSQSSHRLFWQSYGYHHNRYENQLGTFKVLMDYFGNLQVTSKIGMKRLLAQPKFL